MKSLAKQKRLVSFRESVCSFGLDRRSAFDVQFFFPPKPAPPSLLPFVFSLPIFSGTRTELRKRGSSRPLSSFQISSRGLARDTEREGPPDLSLPRKLMPPEPPLQLGTVVATLSANTVKGMTRAGSGEGRAAPSTPSWGLGALFQSSGAGVSEAEVRTMKNR